MKKQLVLSIVVLANLFISVSSYAADGLAVMASPFSVSITMDRLQQALNEKGMTVFARIDHAEGAKGVGVEMSDTQLLIFGNPKIGSPLMLCQPSFAIDLPQKMMAWQDANGVTQLAYNDPMYLARRHNIGENHPCFPVIEKVAAALSRFAVAAITE